MKVDKLTGTDGFVVIDLDDATTSVGIVRLAPKVLRDSAQLLARSVTYAFAVVRRRRARGRIRGHQRQARRPRRARSPPSSRRCVPAPRAAPCVLAPGTGADRRRPGPAGLGRARRRPDRGRGARRRTGRRRRTTGAPPPSWARARSSTPPSSSSPSRRHPRRAPLRRRVRRPVRGGQGGRARPPTRPWRCRRARSCRSPRCRSRPGPWRCWSRADRVVIPDFLATAAPLLAAYDAAGGDPVQRVHTAVTDLAEEGTGLWLAAARRAEQNLATWTAEKPFGRPLA